ncbi:MAG: type II toxin-antitoxin system VapC family toxin [Acidimicrobiales bacterium]
MILVDANVLLYAVNEDADHHVDARAWFEAALNAREPVGFSWLVLLAFMRLSTKLGLFPDPLSVEAATAQVEAWLAQPPSVVLEPTSRHLQVLAGLLKQTGTGGNLVSDAHLAALAVEHAAVVVTYDNDFGRFKGVDWQPPAI